jgi:MFS transporter, DHA1 family, tetracycline resistance protein
MISTEKTIKRLLGIITLDQTYIEFALPIITLVFFDPTSRIVPANTDYATRSMWFGICISTPYFINLFCAPFFSALSDEFGRRKFLLFEIFSAFLYMLCAALGVFLGKLWLLVIGFVIRGAFSRTNTTALAMIGDTCKKNKKLIYMGYLQVAICSGACIGPIIAGLFAHRFYFDIFNFSLPFFIGACLALVNVTMVYFLIDETLTKPASQSIQSAKGRLHANLQSVKYVLTHNDVLVISLMLLLFQISWSSYYQFTGPLLKTVFHYSPERLSIFLSMIAFWLVLGAGPIFKWLNRRYDNLAILNISAVIEAIGIFIAILVYFNFLPDVFIWVSALPTAIGDVLAYICITTLYSNVVPEYMQGKVMGINFLIVGLVWGGTGLAGGFLISTSPILPFLIAPLGVIASLFIINARFGRKMVLDYSI